MAMSTVSSKGQVTIPIETRHRLGVKSGDRVEFAVNGQGETVLRPARPARSPFAEFLGIFPGFKSREEINAWVADMRDDKEHNE
jgi:AbrB family looped-hinge helix DNA binding protein